MVDIYDDGWFKIVAAQQVRRSLAAVKNGRAHLTHLIEFALYFLALRGRAHRAQIDVRTQRVANSQGPREFDKAIDKLVSYRCENVEALARGANLAHVEICRPDSTTYGNLDFNIIADYEGIVAAQLEIDFFHPFCGKLG